MKKLNNQAKLSQQQIWNKIARPWKKYRGKPIKEVEDFLKNKSGKILDLCCGSGRHFIKLKNAEFYGIDFSEKMLKLAEKYAEKEKINVVLKKVEADNLPFEDEFFDSAIFIDSLHSLETSETRKKALQELKRVLKKESEALISVWNKNQPRFKNKEKETFIGWRINDDNYKRYYYLYDKEELEKLLKEEGFKIAESWENKKIFIKVRKGNHR